MSIPATQRIAGPFATALGPGDSLEAQNKLEFTGTVYLCKVYGLAFAA